MTVNNAPATREGSLATEVIFGRPFYRGQILSI